MNYITKFSILIILIINFQIKASDSSDDNSYVSSNSSEEILSNTPSETPRTKLSKKITTIPTLGIIGSALSIAGIYSYNKNKKFKDFIDKQYDNFKQNIALNLILPILEKYDKIKNNGLTRQDGLLIGSVIGSIPSISFANRYFNFYEKLKNYYKINQSSIKAGTGISIALIIAYNIYRSIVAAENTSDYQIHQFIQTLSEDKQEAIFNDPEILSLLADATQDPYLLFDNEKFLKILTKDEQDKLLAIIESKDS